MKQYWYGSNQQGIEEIIEAYERPKMISEGGKYGTLSPKYESLEQLKAERKIHSEKCVECGGQISCNWLGDIGEKLKAINLCFSCHHWVEIIDDKNNPRRIFVKGVAYWRKDFRKIEKNLEHVLGFSGHVFKIKMNSGEEYTTNDLWSSGTIPDRFKERLLDNAVFL